MSTPVTLNDIVYLIPSAGDVGWAQQVSSYLVALGNGGVLSLEGGSFPILQDVNFGPNFGVLAPYFKSGQPNPSSTGVLRLTNSESVAWRNATNNGDLALTVVGNVLYFNGTAIVGGLTSPLTTKGDIYTYSTTNDRQPVGLNGQVLVANSSTGTGISWQTMGGAGGGSVVGFTFINANGVSGSVATSTTTPALTLTLGAITPTSVASTGAISGTNLSGTNTGDQTITLTGDVTGTGTGIFATTLATVPISKGGTGQVTASDALNALTPSQSGQSGKVLTSDGTNISWGAGGGAGGSVTSVSVAGTAGRITSSGSPITTTGTITMDLATTLVSPGLYTAANITIDAYGRITSAANGSIAPGEDFVTTISVDASLYGVSNYTLTANTAVPKPTNIPASKAYTVTYTITQNATISKTLSWFGTIKWRNGAVPIMTATLNKTDIYILTTYDGGTNWFGTPSQGY